MKSRLHVVLKSPSDHWKHGPTPTSTGASPLPRRPAPSAVTRRDDMRMPGRIWRKVIRQVKSHPEPDLYQHGRVPAPLGYSKKPTAYV